MLKTDEIGEKAAKYQREQDQQSPPDWWARIGVIAAIIIGLLQTAVFGYQAFKLRQTVRDGESAIKAAAAAAKAAGDQAHESARANALTIEALSADQRPWIEPHQPTLSEGFKPGRTHYGIDGFYAQVSLMAINRGKVPATHVHFDAEICLVSAGKPSPEGRLSAFADGWRGKHIQASDAIFRNVATPMSHMLFLPQSEIDEAIKALPSASKMKMISPYVIGCITYQSVHTEGPRQSSFAYMISRVDDAGELFVIDPTKQDWWLDKLVLTGPGIVLAD